MGTFRWVEARVVGSGWLSMVLSIGLLGCEPAPTQATASSGSPSPNASLEPPALASAALPSIPSVAASERDAEPGGDAAMSQESGAGVSPPTVLEAFAPMEPDSLLPRDSAGATLDMQFRWPQTRRDGKVDKPAHAFSATVDLSSAGRARMWLSSRDFVLSKDSEIRGRWDRYGFLFVWPQGTRYRPILPGVTRALFVERRWDVSPLSSGIESQEGTGNRLGFDTEIVVVSGPFGACRLEQASIVGLETAGEVLCRLLLDLLGIRPTTAACSRRQVPLHASYSWTGGGSLEVEVGNFRRRTDIPLEHLAVPPVEAIFNPHQQPPHSEGVLVKGDSKRETLVAINHTRMIQYLMVGTKPWALLNPKQEIHIEGLPAGKHEITWRSFLGIDSKKAASISVPGEVAVGKAPETEPAPD